MLQTAGNRIHGTTRQKPLTMFAETEKHFLKPLPDVPVQIAVWTKVKVHGNCHVQFEKAYYSAPFRLVRQELWLKATDTTVKLYHDIKLVATHPRLKHPGQRSTVDEHMPPEALAYKMQDPQWCLKQAEAVGPDCHRLIRRLFAHKVLDNLRAAQGVIRLGKKYGPARLEAACARALHFDNVKYRTVKSILHQGLDQAPLYEQPNVIPLASAYTGKGRFLRQQACREGRPLMNPMPDLTPMLKQLRLSGIMDSIESRNRQAIENKMSYMDFLATIVTDEIARRNQKKLASALRRANFRNQKTLEEFDFAFNPNINRSLVMDLASCRFIDREGVRVHHRPLRNRQKPPGPGPGPQRHPQRPQRAVHLGLQDARPTKRRPGHQRL